MARNLDGLSDNILAPYFSGWDFDFNQAFSASCWYNGAPGFNGTMISHGGSLFVVPGWRLASSSTRLIFELISNISTSHGISALGNSTITDGIWHNAVVTYSGSGLLSGVSLYHDGTLIASVTNNSDNLGGESTTTGVGLAIGEVTSGSSLFAGSIADVAVWGGALSQTEISGLAAGIRPYRIRPSSLKGWWPLFGSVSPEPDLSGNGKNGVVTGTTGVFIGPPVGLFTRRRPSGPLPESAVSLAQPLSAGDNIFRVQQPLWY